MSDFDDNYFRTFGTNISNNQVTRTIVPNTEVEAFHSKSNENQLIDLSVDHTSASFERDCRSLASPLNSSTSLSSKSSWSDDVDGISKPISSVKTSTPVRTPLGCITNTNYNGILSQLMRFTRTDPEIKELFDLKVDPSFRLNREQENILTRRIVKNLIFENQKLKKKEFLTAAQFIEDNFVGQSKESYFLPCIKGKPPSGKLYYCYTNFVKRRSLKDKQKVETDPTVVLAENSYIDEENDHKLKLEWLRTNISPLDTVQAYWKETYKLRENLYKESTLIKYFQEFPVLTTSYAKSLIGIDFHEKYGRNSSVPVSFLEVWTEKKNNIISYLLLHNFKNDDEKLLQSHLKNFNVETLVVPVLWLLPAIIPASFVSGKRTSDGKRKKPSVVEVRKTLFLHVKLACDISESIRNHRAELIQRKGTLQPMPIFVGLSLEDIESSYVLVNETLYDCASPVDAVELTFKSFFAFNTEYPDFGRQVWLFFQYYFFNIKITGDQLTVNFSNILRKIDQMSTSE